MCEVTGFETRTREECEEVSKVECKPITLTKYRTEIVNRCTVKIDDQICNVTYTGVPKQKCLPKTVTKCDLDFDVVQEDVYEEECHVNVQHLCEEYVPVPVHVPVAVVEQVHEQYHHDHPPVYQAPLPNEPPPIYQAPLPNVVVANSNPEPLFSFPGAKKVKRDTSDDLLQHKVKDIVRKMLANGDMRTILINSQLDVGGRSVDSHNRLIRTNSRLIDSNDSAMFRKNGRTPKQIEDVQVVDEFTIKLFVILLSQNN